MSTKVTPSTTSILAVKKYLAPSLRAVTPTPGIDISFQEDRQHGVSVSVFWHSPSLNLSWYPVIQADDDDKTVFNVEGPENPKAWKDFFSEMADRLEKHYS